MRELYNEFFHIPKHGKIREKAMLMRTAITVVIMVVCLAAMSITAYTYFSYNVTSGSNVIKAANFEADVSITVRYETGTSVAVTAVGSHKQTAELEAGTYTIVLKPGSSTAETGFCVITATNCGETYHTQQLGVDKSANSGKTSQISFTLTVPQKTTICVLSHWGTSSHYDAYANKGENEALYIADGETLSLTINGVENSVSDVDDDEGGDETTATPEATTPTTVPAEVVYTVRSSDTLWGIAQEYDVSVEALMVYNGLSDSEIQTGDTLKIPPADYKVPEETTEQTATTPPETTVPTSEATQPTDTTFPETTVTDPADATEPAETTASETTATEPTTTPETSAPHEQTTPAAIEPTETVSTEETQATENEAEVATNFEEIE